MVHPVGTTAKRDSPWKVATTSIGSSSRLESSLIRLHAVRYSAPAGAPHPLAAVLRMVAALAVMLVPALAWAIPFDLNGDDWEGASELVRLAKAELELPKGEF